MGVPPIFPVGRDGVLFHVVLQLSFIRTFCFFCTSEPLVLLGRGVNGRDAHNPDGGGSTPVFRGNGRDAHDPDGSACSPDRLHSCSNNSL